MNAHRCASGGATSCRNFCAETSKRAGARADNYTASTGKDCLLGKDGRSAVAGVSNFVKLPSNDYNSLMQAIGRTPHTHPF